MNGDTLFFEPEGSQDPGARFMSYIDFIVNMGTPAQNVISYYSQVAGIIKCCY